MIAYWKVKTSHEKKGSDLAALYGDVPRYFKTAAEAEERCRELNEHPNQHPWLVGTFFYRECFVIRGVAEDGDVPVELLS